MNSCAKMRFLQLLQLVALASRKASKPRTSRRFSNESRSRRREGGGRLPSPTGCFDDGEIRYKTVVHVDGELSQAAVKRAVRANGIAMETYLPGIGAVIAGTAAQPALERRVDA